MLVMTDLQELDIDKHKNIYRQMIYPLLLALDNCRQMVVCESVWMSSHHHSSVQIEVDYYRNEAYKEFQNSDLQNFSKYE